MVEIKMKIVEIIANALIEKGWEPIPNVEPNKIGELNEWKHSSFPDPITIWEAAQLQEEIEQTIQKTVEDHLSNKK